MTLIKSMTGYGRAVETVNGREFSVELRSVNNRYLDCSVRLPRLLSFGEDAVKQAVKHSISRGKVDVFISVRSEGGDDTKVTLNQGVLEGYLAAMRQMVADYGVQDDISVSTVSRLPDVFLVEKPEVDEEQLLSDLLSVVNKALEGYDAMRRTEGEALDRDLRSRGQTILELVSKVEEGNAQTVIDYRTRLENKLREVLENTSIDESRILTEAAIFADKVAVSAQPLAADEHHAQWRRCCGQKAGLLAAGDEPGDQYHWLQVHRCPLGENRCGYQGRIGKDPGTDPEHRIRCNYEADQYRFWQYDRRRTCAGGGGSGFCAHQACGAGSERTRYAH